ncbi:TPA: hypothetical protein DIV45_01230 [Patescibacteria group bacterium]|nr:hypothetical protein [Patescibacteria group bacterium]
MFTNIHNQVLKVVIGISAVGLVFGSLPTNANAFESRGNTSSAKWAYQSPGVASNGSTVIYANPGDILRFSLKIQNTSKTDVFYNAGQLADEPYPYVGAHELRVGATNDVVYANIFDFSYPGAFGENNNRFATFTNGMAVFPGKFLDFNWELKVRPDITNGNYRYAVGVVQEYDAWLGDLPGPGAGGPNNNLGGRSGGTIFWDIVIGGSTGVLQTLTNSYIGISISYPQPYEAHSTGMLDMPATSNEIQIYKNTATGDFASVLRVYDDTIGNNDEFSNYSLAEWANAFWQFNDSRGYTASSLAATTLVGRTAYAFNVTGGLRIQQRGSGWALSEGIIYKVYLIYNNVGQKIIVYHTLNKPELEQIVTTLKFI